MILSQPSALSDQSELFDLRDRGLLLADGVFDTSLVGMCHHVQLDRRCCCTGH